MTARVMRTAARSTAPVPTALPAPPAHAVAVSNTPILLTLDDDDDDDDVPSASSANTPAVPVGHTEEASTTAPTHLPPLTDWEPSLDSQIYLLPSESSLAFTSPAASAVRCASGSPAQKERATVSIHHHSPSTSVHRRKSPRMAALSSDVALQSPTDAAAAPLATALNITETPDKDTSDDNGADDATDAQFWSGGSRYEVASEPWQIQRWLLYGLKQKIEQP